MTLELELEIDALKREIARLEDELVRAEKYIEMLHKHIEIEAMQTICNNVQERLAQHLKERANNEP